MILLSINNKLKGNQKSVIILLLNNTFYNILMKISLSDILIEFIY